MLRRMLAASNLGGGESPLPPGFASHSSAAAGPYNTTTSYADYLTASITVTTGSYLLIQVAMCGYGPASLFMIDIHVDGVSVATAQVTVNGSGWGFVLPAQVVAAVSAGVHTVKVRVKSSSGSHTLGVSYHSRLTVKEF